MNTLCIISGNYSDFKNLNDLVKTYSDKCQYKLIYSNDGSECYQQIEKYCELKLANNESQTSASSSSTTLNTNYDDNTTILSTTTSYSGKQTSSIVDCVKFTCFVLPDFDNNDSLFMKLEDLQNKYSSNQHRVIIYGMPIVEQCNSQNMTLCKASDVDRPLYCNIMNNCIVCFTGFRKENKNIVAHCIRLVHYMGGSVRKEYNKRITHLIVKSTMSTKYKTAYNIGRCYLLTEDWIFGAWNNRNNIDFNVNDAEFIKNYKLKALYSLTISFYGFSAEETQHMKDVTIENGGSVTDIDDGQCTHIVVNDQDIKQLPQTNVFFNSKASIVKAEWFWASIQMCCRASECLYEFARPKLDKFDPPNKRLKLSSDNLLSNDTLGISSSTSSVTAHHILTQNQSTINGCSSIVSAAACTSVIDFDSPIINTRLSNDHRNISTNLSTSASLLDATTDDAMSMDSPFDGQKENSANFALLNGQNGQNGGNKKVSKRFQRIYELYETEKRFVNILHTIIVYFKQPIEAPDQVGGAILDLTEVKEIFGNLPPIYEVHCKIKDRLERLTQRLNANDESISVGDIYLDNTDSLLKTYPPFINFYEKTKETILNCDRMKPRFHAFLKIAQSKPECGRQTLVELLIRPVQRLPSTLLLLDDILKETPKSHRDNELLGKAIQSLKDIMNHINEYKRRTEIQLAMFDLINDIENCPATLLSSHRTLSNKIDAYEMSSELLKKGAQLTLFLFSDCLEICKPRTKLLNAAKSPNSKSRSPQKCYKHIALFSLNNITKICDISQNGCDTELFGILCRFAGEKDKFFSFRVLSGQEIEKREYIKLLAQGICNVKCITDFESVLCTVEAKQLNLDLNESGGSKKFDTMKRYASRINRRVSRAFSFNQDTPNKIKKTISSVFRSPFQGVSQSLHDQKSSKLSSLASLQLTPTLLERRVNSKTAYQLTKSARNIHLSEAYDDNNSINQEILLEEQQNSHNNHNTKYVKLDSFDAISFDSGLVTTSAKCKRSYHATTDRLDQTNLTEISSTTTTTNLIMSAKLEASLTSLDSIVSSTT